MCEKSRAQQTCVHWIYARSKKFLAQGSCTPKKVKRATKLRKYGERCARKKSRAHISPRVQGSCAQKSRARTKVARTRKLRTREIARAETCVHGHCARGKLRARKSCARTQVTAPRKIARREVARTGNRACRDVTHTANLAEGSCAQRRFLMYATPLRGFLMYARRGWDYGVPFPSDPH